MANYVQTRLKLIKTDQTNAVAWQKFIDWVQSDELGLISQFFKYEGCTPENMLDNFSVTSDIYYVDYFEITDDEILVDYSSKWSFLEDFWYKFAELKTGINIHQIFLEESFDFYGHWELVGDDINYLIEDCPHDKSRLPSEIISYFGVELEDDNETLAEKGYVA